MDPSGWAGETWSKQCASQYPRTDRQGRSMWRPRGEGRTCLACPIELVAHHRSPSTMLRTRGCQPSVRSLAWWARQPVLGKHEEERPPSWQQPCPTWSFHKSEHRRRLPLSAVAWSDACRSSTNSWAPSLFDPVQQTKLKLSQKPFHNLLRAFD